MNDIRNLIAATGGDPIQTCQRTSDALIYVMPCLLAASLMGGIFLLRFLQRKSRSMKHVTNLKKEITMTQVQSAPHTAYSSLLQNKWMLAFLVGVALFALSGNVFAADELGDGTCSLVRLLTGKWLFGISVLALIVTGAAVIFGVEMSDFMKKVVSIVVVVSFMVSAASLMTTLFPAFRGMLC